MGDTLPSGHTAGLTNLPARKGKESLTEHYHLGRKGEYQMYIAKKPCRFGGLTFKIGDAIPGELIDKARSNALAKYGVIEIVPEIASEPVVDVGQANTQPNAENGSDGVKQAFNAAQNARARKPAKRGVK